MSIKKYHYILFFFIIAFGVLLHFSYNLSGQNRLVSYFSAVNESPWEHLKLIFFPTLVFSVFEYFLYGNKRADFWAVKMTSVVFAMAFILIFYYTYSGILGFNLFLADITDFVLADFLCCCISYKMITSTCTGSKSDSFKGLATLAFITLCFVRWTHNPPDLGIFWG